MKLPYYSWVLPIKNEAESILQLLSEIKAVMKDKNWEIIAVNDASSDNTLTALKSLTPQIPQLKIINFKSHQGKWAALTAGFKKAQGEIVIALDSDLQDDPFEVKKLLIKLGKGFDIVSGWRKVRYDSLYKILFSKLGNKLTSILTQRHFHDLNSPFKVYRKDVLESLPMEGTLFRFSLLFAYKLGYRVVEIPVQHRPRRFAKSKFGVVKYIRILYDLFLVLLLFTGSGKLRRNSYK